MREQVGCICNVKFLCIQSILFFQNVVVADILCATINGLVDIVPWSSYDGSNWFAASNDFVTYYLDPRTYLYERFVFAFENLSYEDTQTKSGVESILSGTFMYKSKPSGYSYTYSELII